MEAALLIRNGLTPYEITISKDWHGGKTLSTVLGYLARAVAEKIPWNDPLRESEILYTIPRKRRELILSAIFKGGEYPNSWTLQGRMSRLFVKYKDLWRNLDEIKADVETIRRYGRITESGNAGNRLGYLFEDLWAIEKGLHSIIRRTLEARFGEDWWTKYALSVLTDSQKKRLKSYSDVTLTDLVRLSFKCWSDIGYSLGDYSRSRRNLFEKDLNRLNIIRNRLFHPARGYVFSEEDLEHARSVRKRLLSNSAVV